MQTLLKRRIKLSPWITGKEGETQAIHHRYPSPHFQGAPHVRRIVSWQVMTRALPPRSTSTAPLSLFICICFPNPFGITNPDPHNVLYLLGGLSLWAGCASGYLELYPLPSDFCHKTNDVEGPSCRTEFFQMTHRQPNSFPAKKLYGAEIIPLPTQITIKIGQEPLSSRVSTELCIQRWQ